MKAIKNYLKASDEETRKRRPLKKRIVAELPKMANSSSSSSSESSSDSEAEFSKIKSKKTFASPAKPRAVTIPKKRKAIAKPEPKSPEPVITTPSKRPRRKTNEGITGGSTGPEPKKQVDTPRPTRNRGRKSIVDQITEPISQKPVQKMVPKSKRKSPSPARAKPVKEKSVEKTARETPVKEKRPTVDTIQLILDEEKKEDLKENDIKSPAVPKSQPEKIIEPAKEIEKPARDTTKPESELKSDPKVKKIPESPEKDDGKRKTRRRTIKSVAEIEQDNKPEVPQKETVPKTPKTPKTPKMRKSILIPPVNIEVNNFCLVEIYPLH